MIVYNIFGARERYVRAGADLKVTAEGVAVPGDKHGPPDEEQVRACVDFLSRCTQTKTGRVHSYALKHVIERWSKVRGGIPYVTNGSCILAAKRLSLVLFVQSRGPNAFLGVSKRSVRRVANE